MTSSGIPGNISVSTSYQPGQISQQAEPATHSLVKIEDIAMADRTIEHQAGDAGTAAVDGVPQILPKGIVANTSEIYDEVASYETVPLERLKEYWRVYTTTHRRLYDPTASRLESFWWHVWGSDCRNLSGKTLAKLFESISTGPTFVPLRGPPNRYEGPMAPPFLPSGAAQLFLKQKEMQDRKKKGSRANETRLDNGSPVSTNQDSQDTVKPAPILKPATQDGTARELAEQDELENAESEEVAQPKKISSSSTRPPPSQSILKKPRPSFGGPRPTPRFALPSGEPPGGEDHIKATASDSAAEGSDTGVGASEIAADHADSKQIIPKVQPPSVVIDKHGTAKPDARKAKAKHGKKKFVASVSSSKRKAVVTKRSNSHSSAGSASSEMLGARGMLPPSRQSGQALVEEEIEGIMSSSLGLSDRGAVISPRAHASAPNLVRQAARPKSSRAAGKLPVPLQMLRSQPHTPSPTSTSTAASVVSISSSASATVVRDQRPVLVHQGLQPTVSESPEPSGSSDMMEIPVSIRNRNPARQPLRRPGGTPSRQYTLPIMPSQHRVSAAGQASAVGDAAGFGSPPASNIAGAIPPRLSRSFSQDSYARQRPGGGVLQRPALPRGIGSAAIAAPSMVAASGVFLETEGPDPFELYAQTGLDETPQTDRPSLVESSSYSEHSLGPRQIFTPTRPSQTPRIPFARTRSQLNIILDREKERLGQGNFESWQESRNRDHHGDDHRSGR